MQVTAGAVTGLFGEPAQKLAQTLLKEKKVTVLATDAHNIKHRPPILSEGRAAAAKLIGEVAARRLVLDNPWQIAQSKLS